ncbi:hypothetical protein FCM35_KLT07051 [Carex littledalei]|uniref:Uncharacterized protein n=1 Tax=Carex littledalei TaxID=544730 RepID=A0A833QKZ4_9POAL|nr:hypothetical protein FCM35_KLT07051 [Carex littledalei]
MRSKAAQNAMRSGVVVIGAVAFGYLSFKIGFKPYLDRAQQELSHLEPDPHSTSSSGSGTDGSSAYPEDSAAVVLKDEVDGEIR